MQVRVRLRRNVLQRVLVLLREQQWRLENEKVAEHKHRGILQFWVFEQVQALPEVTGGQRVVHTQTIVNAAERVYRRQLEAGLPDQVCFLRREARRIGKRNVVVNGESLVGAVSSGSARGTG